MAQSNDALNRIAASHQFRKRDQLTMHMQSCLPRERCIYVLAMHYVAHR